MTVFLKLALFLLFAWMGGRAAERLNLPHVTGYLLGGLLLGPSLFNLIDQSDQKMIHFVNEITLAIIAFNIGGEFLYREFKKLGKEVILITIFEVLGVVSLVFLGMYFLFDQSLTFSMVVASMSAATAPAGTVMVINQYRAKGPLTQTILPVAALDDALGIMIFGVVLSVIKMSTGQSDSGLLFLFLNPLLEIILSLLLGFMMALLLKFFTNQAKSQDELLSLSLLIVLFTIALAYQFSLSALLANMMLGATFVNISRQAKRVFMTLNHFVPPFTMLFFAFAGASLDLAVMRSIGFLGAFYVFLRAFGKILGASLGARIAQSPKEVQKYIGWALLPQGGISIGLSMIVSQELPQMSQSIITLILFSVLVFEISGPILAKIALDKAGEIKST